MTKVKAAGTQPQSVQQLNKMAVLTAFFFYLSFKILCTHMIIASKLYI